MWCALKLNMKGVAYMSLVFVIICAVAIAYILVFGWKDM